MRILMTALLAAVMAVSAAGQVLIEVQQEEERESRSLPVKPSLEAAKFIQSLVAKMSSKDARLRFAVREALVVMGHQCVPTLKQAAAGTADAHLTAFMNRTLSHIQARRKGLFWQTGRDLDRLAMDAGLALEMIAKVEPFLKKHDRNVTALWAEFRESGGWQDKEAFQDLQEEIKLLVVEAEPQLKKFLTAAQLKGVRKHMRQSGPFAGASFRFGGAGGNVIIQRVRKKVEKPDK